MKVYLPEFKASFRKKARSSLLRAADSIVRQQVTHEWPHWTADAGRYKGIVKLNDKSSRPLLTITWTAARAAQALLSAYKLSGKDEYLNSAELAMRWVGGNQIFEPELAHLRGAFKEEYQHTDHIAARDSVEAVQGFINLHAVKGDSVSLERAREGARWLAKQYLGKDGAYPGIYIYFRENDRVSVCGDFSRLIMAVSTLVFAQVDSFGKKKEFSSKIPAVMDSVLDDFLAEDGSFRLAFSKGVGHHVPSSGEFKGAFVNDDGLGISAIAAWRALGRKKYLDAALANGAWWLSKNSLPPTYSSIPSAILFFMDLYRLTGDKNYLSKSEEYAARVFELQLPSDAGECRGAFMGEDGWDPGHEEEYASMRTTIYSIMALSKIAAEKDSQWNLAYSAFGY